MRTTRTIGLQVISSKKIEANFPKGKRDTMSEEKIKDQVILN